VKPSQTAGFEGQRANSLLHLSWGCLSSW